MLTIEQRKQVRNSLVDLLLQGIEAEVKGNNIVCKNATHMMVIDCEDEQTAKEILSGAKLITGK